LLIEEIRYRQRRGDSFTVLHFDLTAFKVFNDTYGFARGDQAIHALAACLRTATETTGDRGIFLGHIGGDDFAAVCAPETAMPLCLAAIAEFDACAPDFYDDADRARGYLQSLDRDGTLRRFHLIGLAIGGATHTPGTYADPEALGQHVAAMKQLAKLRGASAFCIADVDGRPPLVGPGPAL
jgi:GGDEF domain-containing protein